MPGSRVGKSFESIRISLSMMALIAAPIPRAQAGLSTNGTNRTNAVGSS